MSSAVPTPPGDSVYPALSGMPDAPNSAARPRWLVPLVAFLLGMMFFVGLVALLRWRVRPNPRLAFEQALALLTRRDDHQGVVPLAAEDLDRVLNLRQILAEDPNYSEHHALITGTILLRTGRFQDALETLGRAINNSETKVHAYTLSSECLYQLGQFGDCARLARFALSLTPDEPDALRWLAAVEYNFGNIASALALLEKIAVLAPTDPRPHRLRGLIQKDAARFADAILEYQESLRRGTNQSQRQEVLEELAECQVKQRQFEDALKTLADAEETALVLALRAECQFTLGDRGAAENNARRARQLDNKLLMPLVLQANLALEKAALTDAEQLLQQAVTLHPHDASARLKYAQTLGRLGRKADSEKELATWRLLQESFEQFSKLHEQAGEKPGDVELRYQIATTALALGRTELARHWLQATLGMDPNHTQARQALTNLDGHNQAK